MDVYLTQAPLTSLETEVPLISALLYLHLYSAYFHCSFQHLPSFPPSPSHVFLTHISNHLSFHRIVLIAQVRLAQPKPTALIDLDTPTTHLTFSRSTSTSPGINRRQQITPTTSVPYIPPSQPLNPHSPSPSHRTIFSTQSEIQTFHLTDGQHRRIVAFRHSM